MSIDGGTVSLMAALVNSQTVEDTTSLTARTDFPTTNRALLEVWGFPAVITGSSINTDANEFSAEVYGNLSDASLSVDGTTVGSKQSFSVARVDRSGLVPVSFVTQGVTLLSDQSVEDLNGAVVTASNGVVADGAQGDLIYVRFGVGAGSTLSATDFTVNENQGTVAVTLNDATSAINLNDQVVGDAPSIMKLDTPTALVNVQSVADQDQNGTSASVSVNQYDADITLSVGAAGDGTPQEVKDGSSFEIDGNDLLASGRLNVADNTIAIDALSQALTGTAGSSSSVRFDDAAGYVNGNAENILLNDQSFANLGNGGLAVLNDNSDLDLILGATRTFSALAEIDGNTMTIESVGNDATNTMTLKVGSFDLSKASGANAPANGQVAILASNQTSVIIGDGANNTLSAEGKMTRAVLDMTAVTGQISKADISVDDNDMYAVARVNDVTNTLSATGVSLPDVVATTAPTANVGDASGAVPIDFSPDTSFSLASRQLNSNNVSAVLDGSGVGVPVGVRIVANAAAGIDGTALSANGNQLVSEANGSNSVNTLALDFVGNSGQAFLANVQQVGASDPTITARTFDTEILVDLANGGISPTIGTSHIDISKNLIAAVASSNTTDNALVVNGVNILSGSDAVAPVTTLDDVGGSSKITVVGDLGLINLQGSTVSSPGNSEDVSATVDRANIFTDLATFNTGSLTIDNNRVISQATVHDATNIVLLGASFGENKTGANIGVANDEPTVSLVSLQAVAVDTSVAAATTKVNIGAVDPTAVAPGINELDGGPAGLSVSRNQVISQATGGSATNTLSAKAGAGIVGGVTAPAPVMGAPDANDITLNADYSLLNVQMGINSTAETMTSKVSTVLIGLTVGSDLDSDGLTVDNNIVRSQTSGFFAWNTLSLTAGASSDATGQIGNAQALANFNTLNATTSGVDIGTTVVGGGALNSDVSTSDNLVSAVVAGNTALNGLSSTAGASLQATDGAGVTITPGAAAEIAVTGAEYAILNSQSVSNIAGGVVAAGLVASLSDVSVGIDDLSGANGVDSSALEVNGNDVVASSSANTAVNSLVLNSGTFSYPSAAIANLQSSSGNVVSASVSNVNVGIGLGGGLISGNSTGSSFTVQGNSIGATAVGNSAVNSITGN